ncbi:hypothetical protein ACP70R_027837 [Stipagrostis hirtigluma subsp. patula]
MADKWGTDAPEHVKAMPDKGIWADEDVDDEKREDDVKESWEEDSVKDPIEGNETLDEAEIVKVDVICGIDELQPPPAEETDLDANSADTGERPAPDVDALTRGLIAGMKPGWLMAKKWICPGPDCWLVHYGSNNLIANIQVFECDRCQMKNPTAYFWTLTRCTMNNISLDFTQVHSQQDQHTSVLYAFLALCDMSRRIRGAKHECDEGMPFGVDEMLKTFRYVSVYTLEDFLAEYYEPGYMVDGKDPVVETLLTASYRYGVPYDCTEYDLECAKFQPEQEGEILPPTERSMKIASWFRVDFHDVEKITRLLGHGFPLLGVVPVGKLFKFLGGGEIYCAPYPDEGDACAVVLHGSGVAMPNADIRLAEPGTSTPCEVFFRCRNPCGDDAHPTFEQEGQGSDFNIWAVHLHRDLYGINLCLYG